MYNNMKRYPLIIKGDMQIIQQYVPYKYISISKNLWLCNICLWRKNARKYTTWAVGLFEGKIFFLILYTIVLLNVFMSYIKKIFSAGLKFRQKNFKWKRRNLGHQYISPTPLSSSSSWIEQLISNIWNS